MIIEGGRAFSPSQVERLIEDCQAAVSAVTSVVPHLFHYVVLDDALSDKSREVLVKCLSYGPALPEITPVKVYWVIPPLDAPTVWGQDLKEALQELHVDAVQHVIRGVVYQIDASQTLSAEDEQALQKVLSQTGNFLIFSAQQAVSEAIAASSMEGEPVDIDVIMPNHYICKASQARLPKIIFSEDASEFEHCQVLSLAMMAHPAVSSEAFEMHHTPRVMGGRFVWDKSVGIWQLPLNRFSLKTSEMNELTAYLSCTTSAQHLPAVSYAVAEALLTAMAIPVHHMAEYRIHVDIPEEVPAVTAWLDALEASLACQVTYAVKSGISQAVCSLNAAVEDVRRAVPPRLRLHQGESLIVFISMRDCPYYSGQAWEDFFPDHVPRVDAIDVDQFKQLLACLLLCHEHDLVLAYQACHAGGMLSALFKMAFSSHVGMVVNLPTDVDVMPALFYEQPGVLMQVRYNDFDELLSITQAFGVDVVELATLDRSGRISIQRDKEPLMDTSREALEDIWSDHYHRMLAEYAGTALSEQSRAVVHYPLNQGVYAKTSVKVDEKSLAVYHEAEHTPKAVLLYRYLDAQVEEMVGAMEAVGFACQACRLKDIADNPALLSEARVLGVSGNNTRYATMEPGRAWALQILLNDGLRAQFQAFFEREDTYSIGTGAGCHLLHACRDLIPGTSVWPSFDMNLSGLYEARWGMVAIDRNSSPWLSSLSGSVLPAVLFHLQGRARYPEDITVSDSHVVMRYVDEQGKPTDRYPFNPDGSEHAHCGFVNKDGRVFITMTHPESVYRTHQMPWAPAEWNTSPWLEVFRSIREHCE